MIKRAWETLVKHKRFIVLALSAVVIGSYFLPLQNIIGYAQTSPTGDVSNNYGNLKGNQQPPSLVSSQDAQKAFAGSFASTDALKKLWEKASMTTSTFDSARDNFWKLVNNDNSDDAKKVRDILNQANYELQGGSNAPILNLPTGAKSSSLDLSDRKLSIDHLTPRNPSGGANRGLLLDPGNLGFLPARENSFK